MPAHLVDHRNIVAWTEVAQLKATERIALALEKLAGIEPEVEEPRHVSVGAAQEVAVQEVCNDV